MPHGEHLIEELDEMEHKEMELIQTQIYPRELNSIRRDITFYM
jgi:hypothetical protein